MTTHPTLALIDAAENSNWSALHELHDLYALATGADFIAHDRRIPYLEQDRAIEWAKRQIRGDIAAARARVRIAELSPEARQVMLLKGMING